ncbi:MAG: glycerophosphoryl diester phosphodiesterase, partial [Silvanigrellaceae bacterium]|nr:glycerophosphoryl diester phosphodiesterase [Silvanigrellaceae bacterium]
VLRVEGSMTGILKPPHIIGHRGAAGYAPENTLASFKKAKELGVPWVEFDVKETDDGVLILMHDDTFERTTNGQGDVARSLWSDVKRYDAGSFFSPEFRGERVPSLLEAFECLENLGLGANIEIKPCLGREVRTAVAIANTIVTHWPKSLPQPLISSFSIESLFACKQVQPQLNLGILFERLPINWQHLTIQLKFRTLHINERHLTKENANFIHEKGYPILVYTVNSNERAQELFSWGIQSVISDFPDKILSGKNLSNP